MCQNFLQLNKEKNENNLFFVAKTEKLKVSAQLQSVMMIYTNQAKFMATPQHSVSAATLQRQGAITSTIYHK